jgi:ParB/RepB/Spo0J family partition protein
MWALHDRLESSISEDTCRQAIESFSKHGQLIPALGRLTKGDPEYDVELIFGARRLFIARHLGRDLRVEVREIGDKEAIISMDAENRLRTDISPYERGMSYARWIRGGHFNSQEDLARTLKTSAAQVSRLLKMARLPSIVVDAFGSPQEIRESWGLLIMDALDDPGRRDATLRAARIIARKQPRPATPDIFRWLVETSSSRRHRGDERDHVVRDLSGTPIFRIRRLRSAVALLVPSDKLPAPVLAAVTQQLLELLARSKVVPQVEERPPASNLLRAGGNAELMEPVAT